MSFGHTPSVECGVQAPLLANNKHRQLVIPFCKGLVGFFSSDLPIVVGHI
jgi:hypothetical protein